GKVVLIGCPKLDTVNYDEKLGEILRSNSIRSITVTRMTVPCCGGLTMAVKNAIAASGKDIPLNIVTIRPDGQTV
ncbi:MAG: ferredoxin, partial [Oscillospiraceae bacterium]|nr:ferredoxin [Oscillospiraceae bacterium]